jgi:hypothetical protein
MSDRMPSSHEARPAGSHYQPSLWVVLVIVVLFIGGAVVMLRTPGASAPGSPTTTTTATGAATTTTTGVVNRAKVTVQVANGTRVTGLAASYTQKLQLLNWATLPPGNSTPAGRTIIYFNPGYVNAAREIAAEIKMPASIVRPRGGANPIANAAHDDIILVLGPNAAG